MRWTYLNIRRFTRLAIYLLLCSTIAGSIISWIVANALVAPFRCDIGDCPRELPGTCIAIESQSGATIRGWHIRAEKRQGVIVLLHGIRASRLVMLGRARLLYELGYSTVMVDLRAHGESDGDYITGGYLEKFDAQAAVEFARREHPGERIGVIGCSLGGAAAILGSPLEIDALVLESVFTGIEEAIDNRVAARLGQFSFLPTALLTTQLRLRFGISPDKLRPIDHIAEVGCPVFVISGSHDKFITARETQSLFENAPEPKELWLVDGAKHEDLLAHTPQEYRERVSKFFDRHLKETSKQ